jgi:putative alpha-1,2-mannosidase
MANEPDIAYPYLFNYVKGEEFRSQELVKISKKIF